MGFLQRFLSLGSRKSKKSRRRTPAKADARREDRRKQEQELETATSRLLRSSSAHFSVVSEVDYASLPPIPHPINSLNPTPVTSPTRSSSIQTRGRTYSVKVLGERKVHARTEFPNANPPMHTPPRPSDDDESDSSNGRRKLVPTTPRDQNRLHGLRQDPSVASLLDMYDDDGHLDSKVFANTPKNKNKVYEGHAQVKRSGSTLRQLMGSPEPGFRNSTAEGDISWAERLLQEGEVAETGSVTSAPSSVLETPKDTLFNENPTVDANVIISTDHEHSLNDSANYPSISSMEVELSVTTEEKHDLPVGHYKEPPTPDRPASEVFGFLLQKGKAQRPSTYVEPPLPSIPPISADSSTDSAAHHLNPSAIPSHSDTHLSSPSHSHPQAADTSGSGSLEAPSSAGSLYDDPPQTATIMNRMPVPVTVASGSRIPRGPRGPRTSMIRPQNTASSQATTATHTPETTIKPSLIPTRDILRSSTNAKTNASEGDGYTLPPVRKAQRRTASVSSTKSMGLDDSVSSRKVRSSRPTQVRDGQKENASSCSAASKDNTHSFGLKSRLPMTPARSRSLFDPPHGSTPSPASSSELSPLGQQMMADLRKTRMRARESERKKSRFADVISQP